MKNKLIKGLLYTIFLLYIASLVKIVLLKYYSITNILSGNLGTLKSYNLIPFKIFVDFKDILLSDNWIRAVGNIFGNVAIFIPLGLLLPAIFKKMRTKFSYIIITSIILSVLFESLQYTLGIGSADIDDVLLNALGCGVGIVIYYILSKITKQNILTTQCIVLSSVIIMALPAYYIAKTEFGSILGITKHVDEYIGNEEIPLRESDVKGTLIDINKSSIKYYKGLLTDNKTTNDFLEKNTSTITKETKIFLLDIKNEKNKSIFKYSKIGLDKLNDIKENSSITLWLKDNSNTADVIVISEPMVLTDDFQMSSTKNENAPKKDAVKENISGDILEVNGENLIINLIITKDLGDGTSVATSGNGKNVTKVNVKISNETTYIKRITNDNGMTHKDEKATANDLKLDKTIEITGTKEGDTFIADSIIIYDIR